MSSFGSRRSVENATRACVRGRELGDFAAVAGSDRCVVDPQPGPNDIVVEGRVSVRRMRSGLVVHGAETSEVHDLTMGFVLQPCLNICFILEGGIEFSLDDQPFAFSAGRVDGRCQPTANAIAIARPALLERRSRRGAHTRKVIVLIEPDWLEEAGGGDDADSELVRDFLRSHLARTSWTPSSRAVALVEQILNPPDLQPVLKELYTEIRALELAAEALQALGGDTRCPALRGVATQDIRRARRARDYIEENLAGHLTLTTVARSSGLSASTLQRLFKLVYGTTVVDYVRARKLERARDAIERQGVSISEAAYLAGYSNPANFATAFKRRFGISPKHLRT